MSDSDAPLLELFLSRVRSVPAHTALWIPTDDAFRAVDWAAWGADVFRAAEALRRQGVRPGDRVAQASENRYEWLVADLALQSCGAIHVPLHATQSARSIGREIVHSGARFALVSTAAQFAKLLEALDGAPRDVARPEPLVVWTYEAFPAADEAALAPRAASLGVRLRDWRSDLDAADPLAGRALAESTLAALRPDDPLKILYTSGTTGESKGVVLTQRNLASNARRIGTAYGARPGERRLNFLALSHVFAQTNDFYATLVDGAELALARARDAVLDDARRVRPTFLNGVPSFYQRVTRLVRAAGRADAPGALRAFLGGRLELCNSGGAPLPDDVFDYFQSQGIPILQGYGLTETSPVLCVSTPAANRRGCVGRPLPDVEIRIAEDGEILARGPNVFAGYYRDEGATNAAFHDGWFRTGDLGRLDADGFLAVSGRKKELIVLANGRKAPPLAIEAALLVDPLFAQAIVFGDGATHLVALVHLDEQEAARLAAAVAPGEFGVRAAERLAAALADRAEWEQVRAFAILDRPFSVESGELTPKHSLRRDEIARRHARLLERLFAVRLAAANSPSLPVLLHDAHGGPPDRPAESRDKFQIKT